MADDIVTRKCEGSNAYRPHIDTGAAMCPMCGKWFAGAAIPAHNRMDILAMLDQPKDAR